MAVSLCGRSAYYLVILNVKGHVIIIIADELHHAMYLLNNCFIAGVVAWSSPRLRGIRGNETAGNIDEVKGQRMTYFVQRTFPLLCPIAKKYGCALLVCHATHWWGGGGGREEGRGRRGR